MRPLRPARVLRERARPPRRAPRRRAPSPAAPAKAAPPSIEAKTAGMQKLDGFVPLYWDEAEGRVYLEIARFGVEMLHSNGFASGLGSNDIGLDRGALAGSRIVMFERVGPKVLLVQPNYDFRASSTNPEEVRAVRDAFARSVLWGFTVAAETGGRVLVDATEWLVRDNLNLAPRLRPGSYKLDEKRSSLYRAGTFNFPKNTEIEVELTYVLQQPSGPPQGGAAPGSGPDFGGGRYFEGVGDVAASGEAASLRIHHSFVELPDAGYRPRLDDPRAGYIARGYQERSARLDEPLERRFAVRHRLEKTDPKAKLERPSRSRSSTTSTRARRSRSARRCSRAPAGGTRPSRRPASRTPSASRCCPPDVHPLDVRYNVINWVHRSTRGWSTGGAVTDPRTGEIIKGVVTLGSLRVRQDYLIAEGLLSPYEKGDENPPVLAGVGARAPPAARRRTRSATRSASSHNYYDSDARPHLGDGLPAPARDAQARRLARRLERLRARHRRVGQGGDRLGLPGVPGRHRREPRRSRRSSTRPGSATCAS